MIRLFYYEWKRLLQNKIFLALVFLTAVFCWLTMGSEMVLGISGAAPFSGWSTGACFSKILPLLLVMEGFFISQWFCVKEQRIAQLRHAAPYSALGYSLLRCGVIMLAVCLAALLVWGLQVLFCQRCFAAGDGLQLLIPVLFSLLPAMLFVLGMSLLLGTVHPALLYGFMFYLLCSNGLASFTGWDLTGQQFYLQGVAQVPVDSTGEPLFFLLPTAVQQRAALCLLGLCLTVVGIVSGMLTFVGNTPVSQHIPVMKKQIAAAMVLLVVFILLLPSPLSGGQAIETAAVAYSADKSAFVPNPLQEQDGITTLETTVAEEGADLALAEQNSLLSVLWPKQTWEKRQRQYQAWGLSELGDGSAQWQGKQVSQLLDCDGSYAYYGSGAETGLCLYVKRNLFGQIDEILSISPQQMAELVG